ncbi:MAG: helix-turn-helix transcriptional regulator [Lachnospiraceae bacterium]|nr:helix-turn-helix transcriptional regulator [Lachnospiraceae bacterium]
MEMAQELIRYDRVRHINAHISEVRFLNEHKIGAFEISYVLRGEGQCRQGELTHDVKEGMLILTNPYEPHSYASVSDKPMVLLTVQIHRLFVRRYIDCVPKLVFNGPAINDLPKEQYDEVVRLLLQTAVSFFDDEQEYPFDTLGYAVRLMGKLVSCLEWKMEDRADSTEKELQKNRARRLIDYIDENYRQKITLTELADMEGITPTYLSHFFKKTFGVSFQQYLSMQRFEKALVLMNDRSINMVDICLNCGFSDSRYLETACRRAFGCSVAEYRSRLSSSKNSEEEAGENVLNRKYGQKKSLNLLRDYISRFEADKE